LDTVVPNQGVSAGNGDGSKRTADGEDADSVTLPKVKATGHRPDA
jgi:hypothetical protein